MEQVRVMLLPAEARMLGLPSITREGTAKLNGEAPQPSHCREPVTVRLTILLSLVAVLTWHSYRPESVGSADLDRNLFVTGRQRLTTHLILMFHWER